MKVLLVTPPLADLNTPYPATAYLTGFLRRLGVETQQADWSLELACRLLSTTGLERFRAEIPKRRAPSVEQFHREFDRHLETIEPVVAFLQGREPDLESRLVSRGYLPEGPRLRRHYEGRPEDEGTSDFTERLEPLERAGYLASLYLRDLSDVIQHVEPGFQLVSYAKHAAAETAFRKVRRFLAKQSDGLMSQLIEEIVSEELRRRRPDVLGLTVPFAGNLVGALRAAQVARRIAPGITIVMGGGFPNCYLRELSDPRIFDFVDFITLDDGERPLECILQHLAGDRPSDQLLRTFRRDGHSVVYTSSTRERDVPFVEAATPSYDGLPLASYLALRFDPVPAHRVWSQRWNKLTLAHGCYWRKCTFCDISLDYVQRYEPQRIDRLLDQIETITAETGHSGFHWVDEAAPPALLRALCLRLLERQIAISWYGNIRFERAFTPELAQLMAEAGCVMITGGLEVASDRLLDLIKKGVTVPQVARVARAFADNGILVHAYLMYGFPTETVQETVDSLEYVRQLFAEHCLHSGYWHKFFATEHSPVGANPTEFGIQLRRRRFTRANRVFTRCDRPFRDPTRIDHDLLGPGLWRALRSFQRGRGLERPVHEWFPLTVPPTKIAAGTIARALEDQSSCQ